MKKLNRQQQLRCGRRNRKVDAHRSNLPNRDGSTLMIVIALLAMLSLVGVVFYTFAAQERSNAEYFAEARKADAAGGQPADFFFDWALRQLIVGPEDYEKQSALWGRNHSMIPTMFGRDAHPYSGAGVNFISDGSGNIYVDQNHNGLADDGSGSEPDNRDLLNCNVSPLARGTTLDLESRFPLDIDVDYTYPDGNNWFISYNGRGVDPNAGAASSVRLRKVIVPSFHRPQLLRSGGAPIADWYSNSATKTRVLRPHPEHVNPDGSLRYVGADGVLGGGDDFPFAPPQDLAGLPGTFGQMGLWSFDTSTSNPGQDLVYELDVDNDGDGIKEGVYLDLGYPVQQLADGTEYVAMFSFTVIDTDALLNLNVHGNSPAIDDLTIDGTLFGGGDFLCQSNLGIGPGEVNLQYAFHANPSASSWDFTGNATALSAALQQYRLFFGRDPASRQELSNMEYFFLTRGRPEFSGSGGTQADVTDLYPGRYGEHLSTLFNAIRPTAATPMAASNFPKPGRSGINDQGTADPNLESPNFVHPLAYNGLGSYWNSAAYRTLDLAQPFSGSSNPSVWLRYSEYQLKNLTTPGWGVNLVGAGANSNLLTWPTSGTVRRNASVDDAEEIIVERDFEQGSDAVFGPSETALAHLSTADRATISALPRLDQLLPFSAVGVETASKRAMSKRVTADSWDRKHFGFPRFLPNERDWIVNRDVDGDGNPDAFPPTFEPSDWDASANGTWNTGVNREPFRDALTSLLAVVNGSSQRGRPQFRLNLNRLLYSVSGGGLAYRKLTDPNNDWRQAQLDRQKMCRDIYVLLYTLGGGRDGKNYSDANDHSNTMTLADPNDFVYTRTQLRQMAQFAVNLVDAMDPDRVVTIFEYDKNLGKTVDGTDPMLPTLYAGWNLNDDPLDVDGFSPLPTNDPNRDADYPQDSIERGVVHGVEAQLMTLSEALWVRVPQDGVHNSPITLYDETTSRHEHLFVEMRNASPFAVSMAHTSSTTEATSTWRMRLVFDETTSGMTTFPAQTRRLAFLRNAGPYVSGTLQGTVAAGGQFTIGASNGQDRFPDPMNPMMPGTEHRPSDLRIDFDPTVLGDSFPLIVPPFNETSPPTATTTASMFPNPQTDLDLVHDRDELQKFAINGDSNPATNKGALLNGIDDFVIGFNLVLDRRADLDRPGLNTTQNPWVEVDRMWVPFKRLTTSSTTESNIQPELAKLKSSERAQPLTRRPSNTEFEFDTTNAPPVPGPGNLYRYNTIGATRNSRSPATFNTWQQHFDREFASVGDLLAVPLYPPQDVTKYAGGSHSTSSNTWRHRPPLQEFSTGHYPLTAASLMLQSQHPSNISNPLPNAQSDNRWYRLLEFVEVPTRTHLALGDPLNVTRVPGRMQLNMFRNPESYVGLIDDSNVVDLGNNYLGDPTSGYAPMPGKQEGTNRDWWEQMIAARDRLDPVTGLYLPGTASSRPFRSLAYVADGNNSVEHTLLRMLPNDEDVNDSDPAISRRLLEIGNASQHQNGSVDPYIRHRLLSKIWGNSTNRSHSFVVFVSVEFFEASDQGNGNVRIGTHLTHGIDPPETVEHRGVFIVNRARIEEATNQGTNSIDWRKLVDFRQTIK